MSEEFLKRGVENPAIVDLITSDPESGEAVLVMLEERPWDLGQRQLEELNDKLNAYFAYVLDGHFEEQYPRYLGQPVRIQLDTLHEPSGEARAMLRYANQIASQEGLRLVTRQISAEDVPEAPWEREKKTRSPLAVVPPGETTRAYKSEILAGLETWGLQPHPTTPPEKVRAFLNELYVFEIRELRHKHKELEEVLGPQPIEKQRERVRALKEKYELLGVPVETWLE